MQQTLKSLFELSGVGLHSGENTMVRVMPAAEGEGRYFVRVDRRSRPIIPAKVEYVSQTTLSTELVNEEATVRTVEHLLAALAASGVDNARIEIDGAEVPLMDGSAKSWTDAIASVGITSPTPHTPPAFLTKSEVTAPSPIGGISLTEPIWIREGDAFVAALPSSETRFTYGIDFAYSAIGNQWHSWNPESESFAMAIAPARTFGFAEQIEQLKNAGLIKGGSLDNALVCSAEGWLNPPLRFANEPVRHKLLDLVGDLSLLGQFPIAHFIAYKASHKLHVQLAKQIKVRSSEFEVYKNFEISSEF
ncbi:MAG: UDP-3-O-acyl-N-acetylglucosamine deacetylase [Xenococcaceae cyanobacterium]